MKNVVNVKKNRESEFGKGLCYCLGLFLAHTERNFINKDEEDIVDKRFSKYGKVKNYSHSSELWFNAASDHLYELEIPENLPEEIKTRLKIFREQCLHFGHGFCNDTTKKNKEWAIDEAKELLLLIDKFYGINAVKGEFL